MPITDEEFEKISEELVSHDIKAAIDMLDEVRDIMTENSIQADIRDKLLHLQLLASELLNHGQRNRAEKFFALNKEISEELLYAMKTLRELSSVIEKISSHCPADFEFPDDPDEELKREIKNFFNEP